MVEIDARTETVRRAAKWDTTSSQAGPLDALIHWFFPFAEAKRYVRAGAALSRDGKWLYVIGPKSIVVVRTEDLSVERRSSAADDRFTEGLELEAIALSPDDARLYAVSDEAARIVLAFPGGDSSARSQSRSSQRSCGSNRRGSKRRSPAPRDDSDESRD